MTYETKYSNTFRIPCIFTFLSYFRFHLSQFYIPLFSYHFSILIYRECKYEQDEEFRQTNRALNYKRYKEEKQKRVKRLKKLEKLKEEKELKALSIIQVYYRSYVEIA